MKYNSEILKAQEENKNKSISEIFDETKERALQNQEKCNSFVTILDNPEQNREDGLLHHIPYGLKDNFSTNGILTTASSNTLKNYIPVFNSTVYQKLKDNGAILIGKTALDEFGMGGAGITCHTGKVRNPWNIEHQAGGSSAGSVASVANGVYPFAIGSDTGDSVRRPAAFCGVIGYKPTYGIISRYGMLPYASSLDHVGVLTRSVYDAALVVNVIKGKDVNDMTSLNTEKIDLTRKISEKENNVEGKRLFYIKELTNIEYYKNPSEELKETMRLFMETMNKAREIGFTVDEISFDEKILKTLPTVYDCISYAEATSNLSNLTGIPFGTVAPGDNVSEKMMNHRTKGFSSLIKRRFVIGSYVLQKENQEKFFVNAQRVRHLVVNKMNELFQKYDALILPCSEGGAKFLNPKKNNITMETKTLENNLVIANFGGYPSITIPNGFVNNLPIGINLTAKVLDDENLLQMAYALENKLGFKNLVAGGQK